MSSLGPTGWHSGQHVNVSVWQQGLFVLKHWFNKVISEQRQTTYSISGAAGIHDQKTLVKHDETVCWQTEGVTSHLGVCQNHLVAYKSTDYWPRSHSLQFSRPGGREVTENHWSVSRWCCCWARRHMMRATLLGDSEKAQQRIGALNETRLECKKRNKAQTSYLVWVCLKFLIH